MCDNLHLDGFLFHTVQSLPDWCYHVQIIVVETTMMSNEWARHSHVMSN